MSSDFVRYVDLKKPPIITLRGKISDKRVPPGVIKQELDTDPPELETTLTSLIYPGNWKPIVDDAFDLPKSVEHGQIHPTKDGHLYMGVNESWVFIGSAIARR